MKIDNKVEIQSDLSRECFNTSYQTTMSSNLKSVFLFEGEKKKHLMCHSEHGSWLIQGLKDWMLHFSILDRCKNVGIHLRSTAGLPQIC